MELLILIVLVLIWLGGTGCQSKTKDRHQEKPSMTRAQRELSAQWASERKQAAALKNVERSVLLEDVDRLLMFVSDEYLADALGERRSAPRAALIKRAADLGRDGAYAIAVANREAA